MKVVLVANATKIGGGNRSLLGLSASLLGRGHDVTVCCPGEGPLVDECKKINVPCEPREYHQPSWRLPVRTLAAGRQWRRDFDRLGVDIVHANSPDAARSVCLGTRRARVPLVCHVRCGFDEPCARWLFRGLPKPDAFVFNSRALQEEVGAALSKACPKAAQEVVYNSADLQRFAPSVGSPKDHPKVGIAANFMPVKGHGDFLEMAASLIKEKVAAEFVLVGGDIQGAGYRATLEARVDELGIGEQVRFAGYCSDMPAALRELDIVVCSSHYESFGRCLIEAMACGKPVVGTRVGGIPEVVEDGVSGLLVSPHQPAELAHAVRSLIEDPDLYKRLASAGRERAESLFGHEQHVESILHIYQSLVRK